MNSDPVPQKLYDTQASYLITASSKRYFTNDLLLVLSGDIKITPPEAFVNGGGRNWLMQASLTNSPPEGTTFLMSVGVSGRLFIVFQHCRAILRYTSYTYSKLVP